jgi:hypothetical protein
MEISEADLTKHFRELSDEALLEQLRAGTLTPFALEVAEREARSRDLEIPDAEPVDTDAEADSHESDGPDEDIDLVTVAQFTNPLKANVLRACLESHGIFAYVWGEHLGVANIFMSIAGGGVRVQVRSDQVDQAREVITAFERGDFALEDEEDAPK